jgi:hypothetical protein
MESSEDRSSNAVRVWMPLAAVAAAITFLIAFVMRIPQEQTIAAIENKSWKIKKGCKCINVMIKKITSQIMKMFLSNTLCINKK